MVKVVVTRACPPVSGIVPNEAEPSRNSTLPVGVPGAPLPLTVTVKVTDWPTVAGFWLGERDNEVLGGVGFEMVSSKVAELGVVLASPL